MAHFYLIVIYTIIWTLPKIYADFSKNIEPRVIQAKYLRGFQQKCLSARKKEKDV